jgi:hypothetical protein
VADFLRRCGVWWGTLHHVRQPRDAAPESESTEEVDSAQALEPFKSGEWRKLSPAERLRRSWRLRHRLIDPQATHDRKLFPAP